MKSTRGVRITGTGSYLPEKVVTNADLAKTLDTSDDWIVSRTGIRERRHARPDEAASHMAIAAARPALEAAGVGPDEVDLIVCATMTPDHSIPSTAALIQRGLGASKAGGYDLGGACAGFVFGLNTGAAFVKSGLVDNVLIIGSEKMSIVVDHEDRSTAVIFADGAGAALLQPTSGGDEGDLLASSFGLRGDDDVLVVPAGGSAKPPSLETVQNREHFVQMKGREVFRFAVKTCANLIKDTCAEAGITPDDLKLVVPHQVNQRILEPAAERAGVEMDRIVVNIDRTGNTSGASVGIALDEAVRAGRIEKGDLILMIAFGAGLSWGSTLFRWG